MVSKKRGKIRRGGTAAPTLSRQVSKVGRGRKPGQVSRPRSMEFKSETSRL